MKCQRCGGYANRVTEHNARQLEVIRCFNCGHRVYPPQMTVDDDFEGILELLAELGGREHWKWVDGIMWKYPDRF